MFVSYTAVDLTHTVYETNRETGKDWMVEFG